MIRRSAADAVLPWCAAHGTGVIVYSPMQAGLLTESFSAERVARFAPDDWRRGSGDFAEPELSRNLACGTRCDDRRRGRGERGGRGGGVDADVARGDRRHRRGPLSRAGGRLDRGVGARADQRRPGRDRRRHPPHRRRRRCGEAVMSRAVVTLAALLAARDGRDRGRGGHRERRADGLARRRHPGLLLRGGQGAAGGARGRGPEGPTGAGDLPSPRLAGGARAAPSRGGGPARSGDLRPAVPNPPRGHAAGGGEAGGQALRQRLPRHRPGGVAEVAGGHAAGGGGDADPHVRGGGHPRRRRPRASR